MTRYTITKNGLSFRLYFSSLEEAKSLYPESIIEICEDTEYLKYIEKILKMSDELDNGWWRIPYGCGFIMYRQFKDGNGEYIDGCEYIRYDRHSYTLPFMKNITDPKSFYNKFFDEDMVNGEHGFKRFTKREFGKLKGKSKPVKFCKIEGTIWYIDGYGNFFEHDSYYTCKKEVEQWEKFHDNKDAVLAKIWHGIHNECSMGWYKSMDDFLKDFRDKSKLTPGFSATPRYEIIKVGYKKKHPYDRENYIRLPYYPITKVNEKERNIQQIVESWARCTKGISYYSRGMYCNFEKVIEKYFEWVDKS